VASEVVNLKLLSGAFQLRRWRSSIDRNAASIHMYAGEIELAVREEASMQRFEMVSLLQNHAAFQSAFMSDTNALVAALMRALSEGYLVLSSPRDSDAKGKVSDPAWAAYKALQPRIGREFQVAMRSHFLVPREHVAAIRQEADLDVVAAREAASIIAAIAKTKGVGQLGASLNLVLDNVVDLNSPEAKSGFVLLRAPVSQAARYVPPEDILTPGKLKKLKNSHWIEVVLQTETGEPWVGEYSIKLPDGRLVEGTTDADGKIRIEEIEAGNCGLSLTELSSVFWGKSAGGRSPSEKG